MYVVKIIMEIVMKLKEKITKTLTELKLHGMKEALDSQFLSTDYDNMDFLARFDELLSCEENSCRNRRVSYLQKQAKLRWQNAAVSDIKYELHPSLKPAKVKELAQLHWVLNGQHVVITGATGTGKTYLACAFAQQAILEAIPVLYFRFNELILNLVAADKNEKLTAFMRRLNKTKLIVIFRSCTKQEIRK